MVASAVVMTGAAGGVESTSGAVVKETCAEVVMTFAAGEVSTQRV